MCSIDNLVIRNVDMKGPRFCYKFHPKEIYIYARFAVKLIKPEELNNFLGILQDSFVLFSLTDEELPNNQCSQAQYVVVFLPFTRN